MKENLKKPGKNRENLKKSRKIRKYMEKSGRIEISSMTLEIEEWSVKKRKVAFKTATDTRGQKWL